MADPAIDHRGRPDITRAIAKATDEIIAERVRLSKGFVMADEVTGTQVASVASVLVRAPVEVLPPIQIRGLAADVLTVKRGFTEIREVVRDVNLVSAALKQDLARRARSSCKAIARTSDSKRRRWETVAGTIPTTRPAK
jgi:hypothetical protein